MLELSEIYTKHDYYINHCLSQIQTVGSAVFINNTIYVNRTGYPRYKPSALILFIMLESVIYYGLTPLVHKYGNNMHQIFTEKNRSKEFNVAR